MSDEVSEGDVVGGRYKIVRRIGSGAGGRIHLALDQRLGDRETAIKFYEPDALIQDLSEHVRSGIISRDVYDNEVSNIYHRFRQEAIGISRLDHAAIVKVYDYEDAEYLVVGNGRERVRNQPFLCMEFIEGMTLEEALASNSISLSMGLIIGSQVADGLAFAHKAGYVHRDLKPSNIMIQGSSRDLQAKIIDWGVAKIIADEAKAAASRLSEDAQGEDIRTRGLLLGTPKFIAPEHFESGGAKWTAASDIFSLGMILFRLLTKRPLRRESYVGECLTKSDMDLLKTACSGQADLTEVVLSCLSEVREERMTAREVRDNLKRIHDDGAELAKSRFTTTDQVEVWQPDETDTKRDIRTVVHDTSEDIPIRSSVILAINRHWTPIVVTAALIAILTALLIIAVWPKGNAADTESTEALVETPDAARADVVGSVAEELEGEESPKSEDEEFELNIEIQSKPEAVVFLRETGEGLRELGTTPFEFTFIHPSEAQRLVFRPKKESHRRIYPEMESTIFAADFKVEEGREDKDDGEEDNLPVHFVKMRCADITDPECNDYLERFNKVFEEEVE